MIISFTISNIIYQFLQNPKLIFFNNITKNLSKYLLLSKAKLKKLKTPNQNRFNLFLKQPLLLPILHNVPSPIKKPPLPLTIPKLLRKTKRIPTSLQPRHKKVKIYILQKIHSFHRILLQTSLPYLITTLFILKISIIFKPFSM